MKIIKKFEKMIFPKYLNNSDHFEISSEDRDSSFPKKTKFIDLEVGRTRTTT